MYIKMLLMLIMGYVRIEVEGYYVERFINICTNKKILIWKLKRKDGIKLCLNIGIRDFKEISHIAKKTQCKIKILRKRGVPFILNKYKKRKIFAIFLIIIFLTIYTSSKYIWNVEIKVEDNLEIENIENDIEKAGIKRGILKRNLDTEEAINKLRLERNDIAWVGIDLAGTNVIVKIVKAKESPKIIDNKEYCDIIATKSGIVTKVIAQNGTAIVKAGDNVNKGDTLIAGYMAGKYTDVRKVHSLGEVKAIVKYEDCKTINLKEEILLETENKENKYEINIGRLRMKLYKNISKFDEYISNNKKFNFKLLKNLYLPFSITKITNTEQKREIREYSIEEAKNKGVEEVSNKLEENIKIKEDIVNKNVETIEDEKSVIVIVSYEVEESIGESIKIE